MKRLILSFVSFLVTLQFGSLTSMAQTGASFFPAGSEVVLLLDTSNSMKSDTDGGVRDAVRQILYSVPSHTRMGLVAYSTDIQCVVPLGAKAEQLDNALNTLEYAGYSNAGLGLKEAVALFSPEGDTGKHIIMVSDGEIDLKQEEESGLSKEEYLSASKAAADRGVRVHIITVGGMAEEEIEILDAAGMTGGKAYVQGKDGTLSRIAGEVVSKQLGFSGRAVGTMEGKSGNFHIELPGSRASAIKILLTGGSGMGNVNADYTAESGRIVKGEHFAVIDLVHPDCEAVDVAFELEEASVVSVGMLMEYRAAVSVEPRYSSRASVKDGEISYEHFADLSVSLQNRGGAGESLWEDDALWGSTVSYTVNGKGYEGEIRDGILKHSMQVDGLEEIEVSVELEPSHGVYEVEQPRKIKVALPPDPAPEPEPGQGIDYRPLWVIVGVLAVALLLVMVLWMRKGRATLVYVANPRLGREPEKYEAKSCQYSGKFNLYVVQTKNGQDIAPRTFPLFGKKSSRITLEWILNNCGIRLGTDAAGDVAFYPGADKAVVVMDQSENCTVMRGMEILKKGIGYPVYFNEKLTVTFEDGITELELHYKNLKPGERDNERR